MRINSIIVKNNELMDAGRIDEQIVKDLKDYLIVRNKYQEELEKIKIREPKNYEVRTELNQLKIKYVKRMLELIGKQN